MSLTPKALTELLVIVALLLSAAHGIGYLFRRLGQPPVIGEILGGLFLGPTVLGALLPTWQATLFPPDSEAMVVVGAIYELGLLLLMFCSGAEIRSAYSPGERKTVAWLTLAGTLTPFVAGVYLFMWGDWQTLSGPRGSTASLTLVTATAVAVTSIPVISRILSDLQIMSTDFARIVLSVAVIEDVLLYAVLTIALALAGSQNESFGLPTLLELEGGSLAGIVYHAVAACLFLIAATTWGPTVFGLVSEHKVNFLRRSDAVAHLVVYLALMTVLAMLLGIAPMFGAFAAGVSVGTARSTPDEGLATLRQFSFAFFIPIYFAVVGFKLDLLHHFDPTFFLLFFGFACLVKTISVFFGGRFAGESNFASWNLAVAMNARGGPGIVLASLTFDAGIVSQSFYATLVLLAVVTSLLAGSWLGYVVRSGRPLR